MYADYITESMERAISETNRRREIQQEYNAKHHIIPTSIKKGISLGLRAIIPEKEVQDKLDIKRIPKDELPALIKQLSSFFRLSAEDFINLPLSDDRIPFLTDTRIIEQFIHIFQTTNRSIDNILTFTGTIDPPRNGYFIIIDSQLMVGIIQSNRHICITQRFSGFST